MTALAIPGLGECEVYFREPGWDGLMPDVWQAAVVLPDRSWHTTIGATREEAIEHLATVIEELKAAQA